ncbi:MAG: DUF5717 family protein [Anaerosacchariphilus sp.]
MKTWKAVQAAEGANIYAGEAGTNRSRKDRIRKAEDESVRISDYSELQAGRKGGEQLYRDRGSADQRHRLCFLLADAGGASQFSARTARIGYSFDGQGLWGGEEIEGEFCIVAEAGEYLLPYTVRVAPHEEPKEEGYAYFISADPIEPLPEEKDRNSRKKYWM